MELTSEIKKQLRYFNDSFKSEKDPDKIITWAIQFFKKDIAMTSALGYSGVVMLHRIIQFFPQIPIYFIDTGYHYKELIEYVEFLKKEWDLNLIYIKPHISKKAQEKLVGREPYKSSPDLCCHYNKVEPLLTILNNHSAWISAIRQDQSTTRSKLRAIEVDGRGTIKVSPLYMWSKKEVLEYIDKHKLPINPMHEQSYWSIGCEPCTRPISVDEKERDGRWPFMQKLECGIHLNDSKL